MHNTEKIAEGHTAKPYPPTADSPSLFSNEMVALYESEGDKEFFKKTVFNKFGISMSNEDLETLDCMVVQNRLEVGGSIDVSSGKLEGTRQFSLAKLMMKCEKKMDNNDDPKIELEYSKLYLNCINQLKKQGTETSNSQFVFNLGDKAVERFGTTNLKEIEAIVAKENEEMSDL